MLAFAPMTQLDPATRSTRFAPTLPSTGGSALIQAGLRRVATYLHLQQLVIDRSVVEVWSGASDPRGWQTLAARGARHITVVSWESGPARPRPTDGKKDVARVVGDARQTGLGAASADVFIALELDPASLIDVVREARRVLQPDGVLVLGVASRELPGASSGASYYDVVDACAPFAHTRMIGVAPFAGTTLVEYGIKDPQPILDGTLVERGERVEQYVAVAGPQRRDDFGYGVVQVPVEKILVGRAAVGERVAAGVTELPREVRPVKEERLVAELQLALERHAGEMRARELELAELRAYVAELEHTGKTAGALESRVAQAEQAQLKAEQQERDARRALAALEGRALVGGPTAEASDDVARLKQRLADAESESWKQMKGRSEAEAAAAALREDNLRKLTDARKVAQAELMRAMEEAAKKALSLRDDVDRAERQRKVAQTELEALKAERLDEAASKRELARAKEEAEAAANAAQAHARAELERAQLAAEEALRSAEARASERLRALGLSLTAVQVERDEALKSLSEERSRAEAQGSLPTDAEQLATQQAHQELEELRARVADLVLELTRRDVAVERAASAAAHERTRSERLIGDQRQALAERNDARAKAAEVSALVAGIQADRERAKTALELSEARANKAESELKEKRERIRELKRELEDVERRAGFGVARGRALEQVRARVHALELAVLGEAGRLKTLEAHLRTA